MLARALPELRAASRDGGDAPHWCAVAQWSAAATAGGARGVGRGVEGQHGSGMDRRRGSSRRRGQLLAGPPQGACVPSSRIAGVFPYSLTLTLTLTLALTLALART